MNIKENIRLPEVLVIHGDANTSTLPGSFSAGSDYSDAVEIPGVEVRICATDAAGYEEAAQTLRKIADEMSIYRKLYEDDTASRRDKLERVAHRFINELKFSSELTANEAREVARLLHCAAEERGPQSSFFSEEIPF